MYNGPFPGVEWPEHGVIQKQYKDSEDISGKKKSYTSVSYQGIFFGGGITVGIFFGEGLQQIQLRSEGRENGVPGAVAP
jgi:hypothetical protein